MLATVLVAIAVLYLLTALAFEAEGRLGHPYRVTVTLTAVLAAGWRSCSSNRPNDPLSPRSGGGYGRRPQRRGAR